MTRTGRFRAILIIAVRETYEHVRTRLLWILVGVAVVLAAITTQIAIERFHIAEAAYRALVAQRDVERTKNNGRVLGLQLEPSLRVIPPPELLSIFANGAESHLPQFWDFGPSGPRAGPSLERPSYDYVDAETGLEFLLRAVIGLVAILMGVNTAAGERASGLLRATLGHALECRDILLGKLTGAAVTLGSAIGAMGLAVLLIAGAQGDHLVSGRFVITLLLICATGTAYGVLCFSAGVLLSVALEDYWSVLTAGFVTWIMAAIVLVPAASIIVQAFALIPPQSVLEVERERVAQKATLDTQLRMGNEYVAALGGPQTWTTAEKNAEAKRAALARVSRVWKEHVTALRPRLDQLHKSAISESEHQAMAIERLNLANPAAQFTSAVMDLAGSGSRRAERWEFAINAYQNSLNERLFDDPPNQYALAPYVSGREPTVNRRIVVLVERRTAPTLTELPTFTPPAADLSTYFADALPQLLAVVLYAIGFVIASLILFKRVTV